MKECFLVALYWKANWNRCLLNQSKASWSETQKHQIGFRNTIIWTWFWPWRLEPFDRRRRRRPGSTRGSRPLVPASIAATWWCGGSRRRSARPPPEEKKTNGRSLVIVLLLHLKLLIIFPFQIRTLQIRVIIQVRGIAPRTGSGPRKVFECKGMWPVHFRKRKLLTKIKIPVRALISGMESSLSCISSQSTFLELSHFQLCSVF